MFTSFNNKNTKTIKLSLVITKKCAFIVDMEGKPKAFSSGDASKLVSSVIEPMAMDGLRTIGIAYKDFVIGKAYAFGGRSLARLCKNRKAFFYLISH